MSTKNDRLLLITGATGNTGGGTARLPLQRGYHVRAFVHRSDARSESLAVEDYENANKEAFTNDGRLAITSPQAHASKERG